VIGSFTSGKSLLAKVKEQPDAQNIESGTNYNANYNKNYIHFNSNFKENDFAFCHNNTNNKKINNNQISSNSFSAKSK